MAMGSPRNRGEQMADEQIRFDDGAAYERMMGVWSRSVGEIFLDWLAPDPGLRWIDVGCGNGAFSELLIDRCAPAEIQGVDPSEAQLAFARERPAGRKAKFQIGNAMALPFDDGRFDAAVMALVLFFVPEPARGVAEMVRVTQPGGSVSAYVWDIPGGGLPMEPIQAQMRAAGLKPPLPPSADVSRLETLRQVWIDAGLEGVDARAITVSRTFADFDEFWNITTGMANIGGMIASLPAPDAGLLKERVRGTMPVDSAGRITYSAMANAVKGRKPV